MNARLPFSASIVISLLLLLMISCDRRTTLTHRELVGDAPTSKNAEKYRRTHVTPHPHVPIGHDDNTVWCATLQLVWNRMLDLSGGSLGMEDAPVVELLNRRIVGSGDLDPSSYVALVGRVEDGILDEISSALPTARLAVPLVSRPMMGWARSTSALVSGAGSQGSCFRNRA